MMETLELNQRQAVVTEAKSWLQTPYHSRARVKGAGVDCAQLPYAVYKACGLIDFAAVTDYSPQWHINQKEERYLKIVESASHEFAGPPLPGDFVLFKVANCWAHGGVVIDWPFIIHAVEGVGVILTDASREPFARKRMLDLLPRFFTLWPGVK